MHSRTIKLPIKYEQDRKTIRQVKLYVARNGENTWYQEAAVPPDRDAFTYIAKDDGIYWFTMVNEDLQGKNVPADLTRTPPDLKVLVDTVQPRVAVHEREANRRGGRRRVGGRRQESRREQDQGSLPRPRARTATGRR